MGFLDNGLQMSLVERKAFHKEGVKMAKDRVWAIAVLACGVEARPYPEIEGDVHEKTQKEDGERDSCDILEQDPV